MGRLLRGFWFRWFGVRIWRSLNRGGLTWCRSLFFPKAVQVCFQRSFADFYTAVIQGFGYVCNPNPCRDSFFNHRKQLAHLCGDRKSTRLNSSHVAISYAVVCLEKKKE